MKTPLPIIILLLTIQFYLQADVRYVSKTGSSTPPYLTWETAADSIQACIDICDNGDTIYVGNGVYKDTLRITKEIYLIGLSADSTIVDGTGLASATIDETIDGLGGSIQNFTIKGKMKGYGTCILTVKSIMVKDCKFYNAQSAISIINGSPRVENVIIRDMTYTGIYSACTSNNCTIEFNNNIIIADQESGISLGIGGTYYISNNVIIFNRSFWPSMAGISAGWPEKLYIYNNLISGFAMNIYIDVLDDTAFIFNNIIAKEAAISLTPGAISTENDNAVVENNMFIYNDGAINANAYFENDYNLFWRNGKDLYNGATYGDSDLVATDPMFVKDVPIDTSFNYDFHLQMFSPAINRGNPMILDKDGTRSDIGIFGGPYGESYTYQDFAPRAPVNLSATITASKITLKWNKNSEADTNYYSVYMDSTAEFIIDSTKLISKQASNLFIYSNPQFNKHYYFKVTATDKQGNQSVPSEEVQVFLTSADEGNYPIEITDYKLYQNYPNPFNPSTKIPYRLKEGGYVKLMVYDIKGELIKVLVNKAQEQGYYEETFDGKGLASGIYLYRIEVIGKGNIPVYSDMKKTILIK